MNDNRKEYLLHKLQEIEEYRDPFVAPTEGTECDCSSDPKLATGAHNHIRVMEAICDKCLTSKFTSYFHAYSHTEGHELLVMEARSRGWSVDENNNYYLCSKCCGI